YFRGGGSGKESSEPLINSSVIYNSIFTKESFSATFTRFAGTEPGFEPQINPFNYSFLEPELFTIPLTVLDAHVPVSIDNSTLTFFWGNSTLPINNTALKEYRECYSYVTSNDNRNVTFCNVVEMDRCAANISDLPQFDLFKFLSPTGENITQFAWMCMKGQVCCAWECCD
ncbi:hypothetical protein PFISCL1PPCAC_2488, partial [Pristionchus fissidentatus]